MTQGRTEPKRVRRQHYSARFYLRNFAEPLFSKNLCVFDVKKKRWGKLTPDGVGWFPHLCSMIDDAGVRTDEFDRYLKLHVEDPAVPAFQKLARGEPIGEEDRSAVAWFMALTVVRSPQMMSNTMSSHIESLSFADRAELDEIVKLWCTLTGKPYAKTSQSEFLKPSALGAVWIWSLSIKRRLLEWEWHWVRTTRNRPFVTSDWPVYACQPEPGVALVSFPVSSELAIVIANRARFNDDRDKINEVYALNRQTMYRATDFVVACSEEFPGADHLPTICDNG